MNNPSTASDFPLTTVTIHDPRSPYQSHNRYASKTKGITEFRRHFKVALIAFILSLLSDALAATLLVTVGEHMHPSTVAVFLVWITVSAAISVFVAAVLASIYLKIRIETEMAHNGPGYELRTFHRNVRLPEMPTSGRRSSHSISEMPRIGRRSSLDSFLDFPLAVRGRMGDQDYIPASLTAHQATHSAAVGSPPATTPVRDATRSVLFDGHPDPLASSPVMGGPPPTFPDLAVLRRGRGGR